MSDSPAPSTPSPLARLMQVSRPDSPEDNPDPAIHRAIALHRESLLRHRLGLGALPPVGPCADPTGD